MDPKSKNPPRQPEVADPPPSEAGRAVAGPVRGDRADEILEALSKALRRGGEAAASPDASRLLSAAFDIQIAASTLRQTSKRGTPQGRIEERLRELRALGLITT
jgi:hypothetical protein